MIALIEASAPALIATASEVSPEQIDDPTPCSEFSVRQLLDHIARFWVSVAMVARNRPVDATEIEAVLAGDRSALTRSACLACSPIFWWIGANRYCA